MASVALDSTSTVRMPRHHDERESVDLEGLIEKLHHLYAFPDWRGPYDGPWGNGLAGGELP